MYDRILSGGAIVGSREIFRADIAISGGRIAAIGHGLGELGDAAEVTELNGLYVFPGGVDMHAHLNEPGYTWREDFFHGTSAAAAGGITTVVDMPLQNDPTVWNDEIFERKESIVSQRAVTDYAFLGALVDYNLDRLAGLNAAGACGFKVFIGPVSDDYRSLDTGTIRRALAVVKKLGGLVCFHAEDYAIVKREEERAALENRSTWRDFLDTRPVVAEVMAIHNVVDLVRESGARAHICHISHPDAAAALKAAQAEGLPISGETCMHYLALCEEDLIAGGSLFKCAPPLRSREDTLRLWAYVEDGTISCIASDHSPCAAYEKDEQERGVFGVWGGISGIQTTMQLFYDRAVNRRGFDPTLVASRFSEGPARLVGLYGRKGAVQVGFDADLTIFDPDAAWRVEPESLLYLNKISAFVGMEGRGCPVETIVRGTTVFADGEIGVRPGYGKLLRRREG